VFRRASYLSPFQDKYMHFTPILLPRLSKLSLSFKFTDQKFVYISLLSNSCCVHLPSHLEYLIILITCGTEFKLCCFIHLPVTASNLSSNILLSSLFLNTSILYSSLYFRDQVLHPYKQVKLQ